MKFVIFAFWGYCLYFWNVGRFIGFLRRCSFGSGVGNDDTVVVVVVAMVVTIAILWQ